MPMSPLYLAKHTGAEIDAAVDLANSAVQPADLTAAVNSLETKIENVKDTTYTFAEGTTNGTILVTEDGGTAQDVPVHGLGTAAYTNSDAYDTAGAATTVKNDLTKKIEGVESDLSSTEMTLTTKIEAVETTAEANKTAINEIKPVIPTEANADNQLVDTKAMKGFVNSSIAAQAANFVTPTADGGQFASFTALTNATTIYIAGVAKTPTDLTKNDYAIFIKDNGGLQEQWRALYNGTSWEEQYKVGSALTNAQQSALDSGITSDKVAAIAQNTEDITELTTTVNGMYTNEKIDEKLQEVEGKIPTIPEATTETAGIVKLGATGGAATYDALQTAIATITELQTKVAALETLLSQAGCDLMFVKHADTPASGS